MSVQPWSCSRTSVAASITWCVLVVGLQINLAVVITLCAFLYRIRFKKHRLGKLQRSLLTYTITDKTSIVMLVTAYIFVLLQRQKCWYFSYSEMMLTTPLPAPLPPSQPSWSGGFALQKLKILLSFNPTSESECPSGMYPLCSCSKFVGLVTGSFTIGQLLKFEWICSWGSRIMGFYIWEDLYYLYF